MSSWSKVKAQRERSDLVATMVGYDDSHPYVNPDPSLYANQARLFQQLSWIFGSINPVTESVGALAKTLGVYQLDGESKTSIKNHRFEQLLRKPNDIQFKSQFDFFANIAGYLKLNGNCYIYANALDASLEPAELWVLRPDRVTITPDRVNFIHHYTYAVENNSVDFEPGEIVHLKKFHPLNDWYGLSAIESLALAAESDYKQAQWNRNFFAKDNAKPQGALAFAEMFGDDAWNKIKSDIDSEYGGTKRRVMKIRGSGAGGVQWLQMGFTQKDMEFLAGRKFTKEEIYSILAPGLLAMIDPNAVEASALAGEKTYREYTLYPILEQLGQGFTAALLPRYGDQLVAEFEDIRHRDRRLELDEIARYGDSHTVDEIRDKYYGDNQLGDPRGKLLPAEIAPAAPAFPGFTSEILNAGPDNSAARAEQRQANEAAKALDLARDREREQFKRFAAKRMAEGRPEKIEGFEFRVLSEAEQMDAKASVGTEAALTDTSTDALEARFAEAMQRFDAAMKAEASGGSWVTINGTHIFIKDGQSKEDAIAEHFGGGGKDKAGGGKEGGGKDKAGGGKEGGGKEGGGGGGGIEKVFKKFKAKVAALPKDKADSVIASRDKLVSDVVSKIPKGQNISHADVEFMVNAYFEKRMNGVSNEDAIRTTYGGLFKSTDITYNPKGRIAEVRREYPLEN